MELNLITGLSCSGKTTYSKAFKNVIHFDDIYNYNTQQITNESVLKNNICMDGIVFNPDVVKKIKSLYSSIKTYFVY